jgi:hypothetical protein
LGLCFVSRSVLEFAARRPPSRSRLRAAVAFMLLSRLRAAVSPSYYCLAFVLLSRLRGVVTVVSLRGVVSVVSSSCRRSGLAATTQAHRNYIEEVYCVRM